MPTHSLLASHPLKPKHVPVMWSDSAPEAFRDIKTALGNTTLLTHPTPSAELCHMTDASQSGIGHILQQNIGGAWQPIAFSHCSLVSLIFKKEGYYSVSHSKVMCNFSILRKFSIRFTSFNKIIFLCMILGRTGFYRRHTMSEHLLSCGAVLFFPVYTSSLSTMMVSCSLSPH